MNDFRISLNEACSIGDLDKIRYLLTTNQTQIDNIELYIDNLDTALSVAITNNQLEAIKYLLSSPELKIHANINGNDRNLILTTYVENNLNLIKYLTSSPDLKEYPVIDSYDNTFFRTLFFSSNFDVISYLVLELGIEKNKDIEALLNEKHYDRFQNFSNSVKSLFDMRDLKNELNNDLTQNKSNIIKSKL